MELEHELRQRLEARLNTPGVPKYLHLVEAIEEMVKDRVLVVGDQLPAESQLAAIVPLSLGTVQKGMSVLQAHGIVSREHGRGTFVRGLSPELRDLWHFRFLADDGETILPVFPTVTAVETVSANGPWAGFLDAEETYVKIVRTINVNDEFTAISEFYVSHRTCADLLSYPLAKLQRGHLRDILRKRFSITTARVVEQVSCEKLGADVCAALQLKRGTFGLACRILAFDFRDAHVSFHLIYVPPGTRRLEMRERMPAGN